MIPLTLSIQNSDLSWTTKELWELFEPDTDYSQMTEEQKIAYALSHKMFPTEVKLTSETYSRNSERSANYVLKRLVEVNAKAKPEFTWSLLKAEYVTRLLTFLQYHYDYTNSEGDIVPEDALLIKVKYLDFTGIRTIEAYLGQTLEGTLVEYDGVQYWENFRIAFPER